MSTIVGILGLGLQRFSIGPCQASAASTLVVFSSQRRVALAVLVFFLRVALTLLLNHGILPQHLVPLASS